MKHTLCDVAALLLFACHLGAGQAQSPSLPATPAGRQFEAWLRSLNAGDAADMKRFIQDNFAPSFLENFPLQEHVDIHASVRGDTGGLLLKKVEDSKDHEIAVTCEAKQTGAFFRVMMQVESAPPHKISGVGIMTGPGPSRAGPRVPMSDEEIVRELEAHLEKLVTADRFSGAVLVAKNGLPLFRKAYGLAHQGFQVPNRIDTKFNLGSMNKMFTAVAVAQLAQQGKLAFDDTVGKHLPDYPNKTVAEKVTIHQLLTHTSGLGTYFNRQYQEASKTLYRAIQDYYPLFAGEPLSFEPGQKFQYSNSGFMLLGAIVERVSGQEYFDYVREHVYKPAGMVNSDCYELDRDIPNLAFGYTNTGPDGKPRAGARWNNLFLHVVKGGPAGGGYSTVEDLLRFAEALRSHRLLDRTHTELVLAGKVETRMGEGKYAYGFFDEVVEGERIVGHGGGFPGISSQLDIYLNSGYTVAVMSNYDGGAQLVNSRIRELLSAHR